MKHHRSKLIALIILLVLIVAGLFDANHLNRATGVTNDSNTNKKTDVGNANTPTPNPQPNPCLSNTIAQVIIVGIDQQHMWACSLTTTAYSSAVITGYSGLAADVTPTGNYTIYAKETNVTLTGNDGVTTWHDPVSYWMPFLFNQYGAYGFHDATWRTPSQFGNISPSSQSASHGCIELPLATAQWLYSWSTIGTQIQIKQSI